MFGPQWGVTRTTSVCAWRMLSRSQSGAPLDRSAKATPGRLGAAAYSRGWSVTPRTPHRTPPASSTAGARACSSPAPAPTHATPTWPRCSSVSRSARGPKSSAWLLARVTQSTPRSASASAAAGGARKWKARAGQGAPLSEMQHSRFSTQTSAARVSSTTSAANSAGDGREERASATPRPSMASPASASLTAGAVRSPGCRRAPLAAGRAGGERRVW
jgi:hypothetical protein